MSLIGWLMIGVLLGLAAHGITRGRRASRRLDMALGAGGGLAGGLMFWAGGGDCAFRFNIYSMVVAAMAAVAVLLSYHALFVYPGNQER